MKKIAIAAVSFLFILINQHNLNAQTQLKLKYNWQDSTLVASSFHNNVYNEIWGFEQNGKEYAVIGSSAGTHIFDVSNLNNIYQAEFIPGAFQGIYVVHRDYHDYNGYLYMVCDEGPSTLQIADLSHLPDSAPLVYDSNNLFERSHNIFIDSAHAKLYVCGGNNQLNIYSLANPKDPQLIVNCATSIPGWNQIGYLHDIYVEDNIAYCNAENRGLFVVDFTNSISPNILGSLTHYPDKGYNHSGWLNSNKMIYALADETHGMQVKILDVSNPSDITVLSLLSTGIDSTLSIPHNVLFNGNNLYVSYYHDGVYVFDLTDPSKPVATHFYDTSNEPHALNYRGCWGVYPFLPSGTLIASDMQTGLFVFEGIKENNIAELTTNDFGFSVFPNPATNYLKVISNNNQHEQTQFQITSITGQTLLQGFLPNNINQINLDKLPSNGLYFIKITHNQQSFTSKFLKL